MPMKPEAKAKQKAQQEARWAKDRGEAAPTPTKSDEPEMPITPAPEPKKPAAKKAATKKK